MDLFLEAKEAKVTGAMGAKAGNFDIIAEQVGISGDFVDFPGEELFLVIESWSPGEVGPDFQVFTQAVLDHVGGEDAFGGVGEVGTSGGVDMMISGPPAKEGGVNPAFEPEGFGDGLGADFQLQLLPEIFGTSGDFDIVHSGRQDEFFTVGPIDLWMKMKVGRCSLGLRWIDAALGIPNQKFGHGGLLVFVEDFQGDGGGGFGIKGDQ